MNLLDTASLVVTPNGYKASKLYSIIPSDGTGDMTFARTGDTATRVNSSGLIETVLADKPRLDYLGSTCPKLLLEPQRTNLITYSNAIDNVEWEKTNISVTANATTSPDGTTNAEKLVEDSANQAHYVRGVAINFNSGSYTLSIFAKAGERNFIQLLLGSAVSTAYANFDLLNGVVSAVSSSTATIQSYGNGWYRCSMTFTAATAFGGSGFFCIQNSGTATRAQSYLGNGTNGIFVYGAQVEAGAYATSYIPTTTASVTRNADSCTKSSATALIGQTEGTILWDGIIEGIVDNGFGNVIFTLKMSSDSSADRYLAILTNKSIRFVEYSSASTQASITTSSNFLTLGNRYKIGAAYKQNDFVLYINGVQIGTDTSGVVFASNEIYFHYYLSNYQGLIKNNSVALWKTRLTNQELVTLTTL